MRTCSLRDMAVCTRRDYHTHRIVVVDVIQRCRQFFGFVLGHQAAAKTVSFQLSLRVHTNAQKSVRAAFIQVCVCTNSISALRAAGNARTLPLRAISLYACMPPMFVCDALLANLLIGLEATALEASCVSCTFIYIYIYIYIYVYILYVCQSMRECVYMYVCVYNIQRHTCVISSHKLAVSSASAADKCGCKPSAADKCGCKPSAADKCGCKPSAADKCGCKPGRACSIEFIRTRYADTHVYHAYTYHAYTYMYLYVHGVARTRHEQMLWMSPPQQARKTPAL